MSAFPGQREYVPAHDTDSYSQPDYYRYANPYYDAYSGSGEYYNPSQGSVDPTYDETGQPIGEYAYPVAVEGEWTIQCAEYLEQPVLATAYDPSKEILWSGQKNGRVSGYVPTIVSDEAVEKFTHLRKAISFQPSKDPVIALVLSFDRIIVVTETGIKVHYSGGLCDFSLSAEQLFQSCKHATIPQSTKITCAAKISSFNHNDLTSQQDAASFIFVGTDQRFSVHWSPFSNRSNQAAAVDMTSASTVVRSNGNVVLVGGKDGKVRYFDCRFRSSKLLGSLTAHTGPVSDVAAHSNGETVFTCGYLDRVNTHASSGQVSHLPDPLVKIFDLRTSRLLGSLAMTLSTPKHLLMLPTYDQDINYIVMVSLSGVFQIRQIGGKNNDEVGQVVTLPLSSKHEQVLSVAASSSGLLILCGSSAGMLLQLSVGLPTGLTPRINIEPVEFPIPAKVVPSENPLSIETPSLASSFVFNSSLAKKPLSSSFLQTPGLLHKRWKLQSTRKISPAILAKSVKRDFLSTVPNPGFKLNSTLSPGSEAYLECDPRRAQDDLVDDEKQQEQDIADMNIPPAYRRVVSSRSREWKGNVPRHQAGFDYNLYNSTNSVGLENSCPNSYTNSMIHFLFSVPAVRHAALSAQTNPFYYSNPQSLWCELGFLFHMLAQKANMLQASIEPDAAFTANDLEKAVIPSNFQRTFSQLPEVAALSLLDSSKSDAQARVVNFSRFILQQLQIESENEHRMVVSVVAASGQKDGGSALTSNFPIEATFGFTLSSRMTYLQSESKSMPQTSSALTIDLVYPQLAGSRPDTQISYASFASVLWRSFQRETFMRAWCSSSESYERSKQVRSVIGIPSIAGFLCGETISTHILETLWCSLNKIGGPWLSSCVEVTLIKSPASEIFDNCVVSCLLSKPSSLGDECTDAQSPRDEQWQTYDGHFEEIDALPFSKTAKAVSLSDNDYKFEVVYLRLAAVVSSIVSSSSASTTHTILHLNRSHEPTASWLVYNDFTISSSTEAEAMTFNTYKRPVYLAFVKQDFRLATSDAFPLSPYAVPPSVLSIPSLSSVPSVRISMSALPKSGSLIAFDGEYVSVELSKSEIGSDGKRVVNNDGRQVLARMSLVDDQADDFGQQSTLSTRILVDDYILPGEPVLDYVTRYSGLSEEDLSPVSSRHAVISRRAAYLKLRFYLDRGVVFVGHGLQKDFEIANVVVPSSQIRDTVELWRLPGQRKISLKYLASFLLRQEIQEEIHDSIEDAKTALLLYRQYERVNAHGKELCMALINKIYYYGNKNNWTIGLESIEGSSKKVFELPDFEDLIRQADRGLQR